MVSLKYAAPENELSIVVYTEKGRSSKTRKLDERLLCLAISITISAPGHHNVRQRNAHINGV